MLILQTHPNDLPFEALEFLQETVNSGANLTIKEVLESARNGHGSLFVVTDEKVIGAFYLEKYAQSLNLALLGGIRVREWGLDSFIKNLMREENVDHLIIVSRKAWGRVFKDLEILGTIYHYHNESDPPKI